MEHQRPYEVAKQIGATPADTTEQLVDRLKSEGVKLEQPWYEAAKDSP